MDFKKINIDSVSYNVKDSTARKQISDETSARKQEDAQLSQKISNETTAREQADSQLSQQISELPTGKVYDVYDEVGTTIATLTIPDDCAIVWFRPASYILQNKITINKEVKIICTGASIQANNGAFALQKQSEIDGGTFFNSGKKNIALKTAFIDCNASGSVVKNCTFRNAPAGITITYGVSDVVISNCIFSNLYSHTNAAVWTGDKNSNILVENCYFEKISLDGIHIDATHSRIEGCYFDNIGNDGPYHTGAAGASAIYNEITGTNIELVVDGCEFYNCGEYAVNANTSMGGVFNCKSQISGAGGIRVVNYGRYIGNLIISSKNNGVNVPGAFAMFENGYMITLIGNQIQGCTHVLGAAPDATCSTGVAVGNAWQSCDNGISDSFTGTIANNLT